MVPPCSDRISRVPPYSWITSGLPVRGYHPLWPDFPDGSGYVDVITGLVRVRSPLLTESRLMSFPPGTEMFQFPGFASVTYGFSAGYRISGGFPHSEICGSKGARPSPQLIAACHVLHRLSVPRHPPDALRRLISASSTREAPRTVASALTWTLVAVHRHLSPQPEQSSPCDHPEQAPSGPRRRSFRLRILFTMSNIRGRRSGLPQLHPELRSVVFSRSSFLPSAPRLLTPDLVEADGIEPTTSCLQSTRSPN